MITGIDIVHLLILKMILKVIMRAIRDQGAVNGSSLYKLIVDYTGMSVATVYRKIADLMSWGYIIRADKNHYIVTTKGLIALELLCVGGFINDHDLCQDVTFMVGHEWDLDEFGNECINAYFKLLMIKASKDGLDPLHVLPSLGFPKSVLLLIPNDFHNVNRKSILDLLIEELGNEELVMKAQGIIAKALMMLLPTTTLNDGCKAVTVSNRVIALKCKVRGYTLDSRCPFLVKING
ncbi:HTH domain-containing protein [Vulcanisaeta distributa]|uniref:Uncharacterized protein n=1 Tax=Vulcanisaeta distributa (strain DSM 14429 / JCM 11212 / NBRC 100878 / IC-017) TaxID=572478 RepID=E1QSH7_VULDI|nr:HTH domain-containing protein [Vulcanisaeta distributa]ADN50770.1 hypothetical protein Vdis_1384 [Vulcanisaeta distributa DSM 14429]